MSLHPHFITDTKGKKLSVVLSIEEFNALLEELEELEDIRLYDQAKADRSPAIPIEEAFAKIEQARKES